MLNIPSLANMMAMQPAQPPLMDWQRQQLMQQYKDQRLVSLLNNPLPGQAAPGMEGLGQQPPRMALGGGLMPGMSARVGDRPSGAANPVAMTSPGAGPPGTVWSAELRRWVPLKKSVGGMTNWNVADFGKYNGFGTSQGPIGSVAPGPRMSSLPGGGLMQGQQAPAPQPTPTAQDNFTARLATGNPLSKDEITAAHKFATLHQRTFDPSKGYSQGIPGYATGGSVAPGQTVRVGDKPDLTLAQMAALENGPIYVNGKPQLPPNTAMRQMANKYGSGRSITPRPETAVTANGIQTVGQNGEEILQPDEPTVIIPHPKSVQEALRFEQTSAALPVAMQQYGLAPQGQAPQGIPGVPAPRKTDLRRFGRSEAGVRAYVMQQQQQAARGQHIQDMDARDNKMRGWQQADNLTDQERQKAERSALAAEEASALDWVAEAGASDQQIYSKTQLDMIKKAPNAKAKSLLISTFAQQNKADKDAQDEDITGVDFITSPDGSFTVPRFLTASGRKKAAGGAYPTKRTQNEDPNEVLPKLGPDYQIETYNSDGSYTIKHKKAGTMKLSPQKDDMGVLRWYDPTTGQEVKTTPDAGAGTAQPPPAAKPSPRQSALMKTFGPATP